MSFSPEIIAALERGDLVLRDFFIVHGKDQSDAPITRGYWTGAGNIVTNVVPPGQTTPVSRNFVGTGALQYVPEIVDAVGIEYRSYSFGFDHISSFAGSPMDTIYGQKVRVGRVEYYQGFFDPDTHELIDRPVLFLAGRVDGAEVEDAAPDSEGGLSVDVASVAFEGSKTNPAMMSHAEQSQRDGDQIFIYSDTTEYGERWWGLAKENG